MAQSIRMIRKVRKLGKRRSSVFTATFQVSAIVFAIKFLGFIKQSVIAASMGATIETDTYFIATNIMTALGTMLFSAISISLLSMYTQHMVQWGRLQANALISQTLKVFLPIALGLSILFIVASPAVAAFLAPGYQGEQRQLLAHFIRLMSVSLVFACYYLIYNVILEADKRFLPGKAHGFFLNLFLILAAIFFTDRYGIHALVYAFVLAGLVQCFFITWCARKTYHFTRQNIVENKYIWQLIQISLPLLIGNAIYEINDIVDKQVASGLGGGSVSVLSYGASINEIVTTLIITSVSTVLYAHYTTWIAEGEVEQVGEHLKKTLLYLLVFILPIMLLCISCSDEIVRILYGRGNFSEEAVQQTCCVVIGYAVGFPFQAARDNLIKFFYAFQNTKIPMKNGAIAVSMNVVMSLLLSRVLGAGGIAIATSIAMLLVTILLLRRVPQFIPNFSLKSIRGECARALVSMVLPVCGTVILHYILADCAVMIQMIVKAGFILCSYIMMLYILKSRCLFDLITFFRGQLQRKVN